MKPNKQGLVSDEDLPGIGAAVQGTRKRLGRALRLKDNELDVTERENLKKIYEQSYQILLKWLRERGGEATYHALAQALCDRTLMMRRVMNDYCLTLVTKCF